MKQTVCALSVRDNRLKSAAMNVRRGYDVCVSHKKAHSRWLRTITRVYFLLSIATEDSFVSSTSSTNHESNFVLGHNDAKYDS